MIGSMITSITSGLSCIGTTASITPPRKQKRMNATHVRHTVIGQQIHRNYQRCLSE